MLRRGHLFLFTTILLGLVLFSSQGQGALLCPQRLTVTYDNFARQPISKSIMDAAQKDQAHVIVAWSKLSEFELQTYSFTFERKTNNACIYRKKFARRRPLNKMPVQARIFEGPEGLELKTWFQKEINLVDTSPLHPMTLHYQISNKVEKFVAVEEGGIELKSDPGLVSVRYNHKGITDITAGAEVIIGLAKTAYTDKELPLVTKLAICKAVYVDYYEYGDFVEDSLCLEDSEFTLVRETAKTINVNFVGLLQGTHTCRLKIKKPIHNNDPAISSCSYRE